MKTMSSICLVILGVGALALAGCAHAVPAELANARTTCQRTTEGPAAQLVPAELHQAETVLAQAEKSFSDDPESFTTRDLSYVAQRKCELAEVLASTATEQGKTAQALADFSSNQSDILKQTKANLGQARTSLMAALAKLAEVKTEDRGVVITLSGSVLFRSGEATLLPEAQKKLDQVAEALLATPDRTLVVEGHTDSQGSDASNMDLSQRRADAVRAYLVQRGYASTQVVAQGLGEGRPIADNTSPEGRSNNRRVEIVIQPAVSVQTDDTW